MQKSLLKFLIFFISLYSISFAANSTNYSVTVQNENAATLPVSTSTSYSLGCGEVGKIGEGIIASNGYSISHNLPCSLIKVFLDFRFAPEKRVPIAGANLDMEGLDITLRAPGSPAFSVPLYSSLTATGTDINGFSASPTAFNISPGVYVIFIKSAAHLNQKYGTLNFTGSTTTVDFSQSLTKFAKAGDVNGLQFGDDEINSLDISVIIQNLNTASYRSDVNQDDEVNALDVGILIANLNQIGE
jgi:Dockerin type I domain